MRRKRIAIVLISLMLPMSLFLCSCGQQVGMQTSGRIPEHITPATATVIRTNLSYNSTQAAAVRARAVQSLGFDGVSGTLIEMYAGANEFVRQGEKLAQIDSSDHLIRIERSEIDKQLQGIRQQQRVVEGLAIEAAFTSAREDYSEAASEYRINPTDINKRAADKAMALYLQAAYGKKMFDLNSSIDELENKNAFEAHEKLLSDLGNCSMTAPSNGIILSVSDINLGAKVVENSPIFSFISTADLLFGIMSRDSMYLRGQEKINVIVDGYLYEGYSYEPVRGDLVWSADMSKTQMYIAFHGTAPDVIPGVSMPNAIPGVSIPIEVIVEKTGVLAIPRRCVKNVDGITFVEALHGEEYISTPVTVGIISGNLIEIESGLSEGDIVLAE